MILQVHDELFFDTYKDEIDILTPKVEDLMKNAIQLDVHMQIGMTKETIGWKHTKY